MSQQNPWQRLSSRIVYSNPWISVREDLVIRPDGKEGIYGVVELPSSVGVVALDPQGNVLLVGQWRYVHNRYSWEIPTGGSSTSDPSLEHAAARELEEEAGVRALKWNSLGSIDNSNGATTDVAHLFLAQDLSHCASSPEPEESITVKWVPFKVAVQQVMDGLITESCSVAALLKADRFLNNM